MDNARSVFGSIVLEDALLLAILNILPVRLERNVEDGISSKDELSRSSSGGCMNRRAYSLSNSREDAPPAIFVEVGLTVDLG